MTPIVKLALYFVGATIISLVVAPILIRLLKKLKAGQNILGYVIQHESKAGTPTMGGLIFLIPVILFSFIEWTSFSLVGLSLIFGFAVLGFLDDFIKIKFNRNLGLKAYQKIIGQLGLGAIAGYFVYKSNFIGSSVNIPYLNALDLKLGIIPIVIFIYVATTNSVNLTDGIDGLAGTTAFGYFIIFAIMLYLTYKDMPLDEQYSKQYFSLVAMSVVWAGSLLGYLIFNAKPAKVFMGDTGSLALGSGVATVAVFSKNPLFIATIGIMFVWSSISVIIQVICFKATGKRVFKMSPFHHHLEMCGFSETRICALYFLMTMLAGALTFILWEGL